MRISEFLPICRAIPKEILEDGIQVNATDVERNVENKIKQKRTGGKSLKHGFSGKKQSIRFDIRGSICSFDFVIDASK